ncbi:dihydrofolate reductase family protein [Sutcliffiella cohnii]|uniref:dihydrofolate reductase family protein n=1 Tax=Sutcliffiella cohnii TaxID=33932 RepID=UPI002E1C2D50|nr:dihydrofolate reductase family protein [Sutcliffiella cohnii]
MDIATKDESLEWLFVEKLKSKDGKNIWIVGGGELLHSFIQKKLVDEIILTVAPTLIGNGIPLFGEGEYNLDLSLIGMTKFKFVELNYLVKNH